MLKTESKRRLWSRASLDILYGGARAMVLAERIKDPDAMDIVSRVYSVGSIQENPFEVKECRWCGADFVPDETDAEGFCGVECQEVFYS